MSVHSHPTAHHGAAAPEFPRHVVTAVLVSHDGARWLPQALSGLLGQERPVQSVIAADTGSADESAALLTETLGPDRVLHLARRSSFGAAVDEAVRTAGVLTPEDLPYLRRPSGWDPVTRTWRDEAYDMPELPHGEPVQWLWLLHDDCAPEPGALAELLRVVEASPSAVIIGPKLRGWYDRRQLLEVGVSIANSGRRWTGLDRREQDQGQHDQVRPVLSVSSAGMLIRRDVWEELGGFDRRLPLMRDDVDLCWRAQAAGHRVLVAPDAVLRHAEASARERRPIDCAGRSVAGPHRVDKAGAVYTMLVNSRGALLPYVMLRLVLGTLLRTLAYLVGKVPGQAVDEVTGLLSVLLRPGRVLAARRRRGRAAVEQGELRHLFPPTGATLRATVESVAGNFGGRSEPELASGGRHGAVESGPGGDDADFLEIEQFARLKRIARKPAPVLFLVLLLVSLIACRGLLGPGALSGGALLPAPADASELWARYTAGWHAVGVGGTESAPPYLAVVASLATVLFGSTGLAVTLLLVCSVPLAGLTAYFASRPLTDSRLLRAWGSVAYAFLPAATGALAGGRLGTAVLAVVLPLMARAAVAAGGLRLPRQGGGGARPSWRAAWAYALLLTLTTAFTPIVWPIALVLGIALLVLRARRQENPTAYGLRFAVAQLTPLLVLAPWSLSLLTGPSAFLREAGLDYGKGSATALDLLAVGPGGPKATGGLLLIGLVLAGLAALLRGERQWTIRTAWAVALTGLLFAAIANGSGWAGPATLVYGIALITAATVGAEGARERVAAQNFGWRQPVAALIALAAAAAPVLAAFGWMFSGADGPLERSEPVQVPAFVAEESGTRDQPRTLVIGGEQAADVSYALVRGSGARLGDAELSVASGGDGRLDGIVANLVAGSGADQTRQLGGYAVRYVLVRDGAPREMSRVLDSTPGLTRLSQQDGSALWRVDEKVARITILPVRGARAGGGGTGGSGTVAEALPVAAQSVEAHTDIPDGTEGRILRIADRAAPGWRATLDGKPLTGTTVDGWAQGFELPASGGRLDLTYETPFTRTAWVWTQGFLALVVLVLALPGRRRDVDDDMPDQEPAVATVPAQAGEGEGRRARRLRAAAEADQAAQAAQDPSAGPQGPDGGAVAPDAPGPGEPARAQEPAGAPGQDAYAGVPQQQQPYGDWDPQAYAGRTQTSYAGYQDQYQGAPYPADAYGGGTYEPQAGQYGQYGAGQYTDPYGYSAQQPYSEGAYPPQGDQGQGVGDPAAHGNHGGPAAHGNHGDPGHGDHGGPAAHGNHGGPAAHGNHGDPGHGNHANPDPGGPAYGDPAAYGGPVQPDPGYGGPDYRDPAYGQRAYGDTTYGDGTEPGPRRDGSDQQ
ncbi:glycosyltransferase [Streptomyces sp. NPDC051776]|uniref:glycosyltransferase n=1 Tax=Streptomyces sp. NPDC051776 TaxID=3155414 RepID=UPI003421FB8C